MKIKVFKHAALTMLVALMTVTAFAQQTVTIASAPSYYQTESDNQAYTIGYDMAGQQDTAYRAKMDKLQSQIRDLQRQMNSLRTEESRKNAEQYRKNAEKIRDKMKSLNNITYAYSDSISGSSKKLGVLVIPKTYAFSNKESIHISDYGDDYIRKKIQSGDVKEKTKTYSKSYSVDRDDKIQIDNKFGRITVNTWGKNEVKVEVQIKADADDDDAAQKLLNNVTIADSKDNSTVAFKTSINENEGNNWGTWIGSGKSHVHKIEVNYIVYMPSKSALTITNKFGSVKLPDLNGKLTLNLSNGNLTAQQLTNPSNTLNIRFGDADIETINCENLNMSYGKLNVGTADNINARINFAGVTVDRLKTSANISVRYGDGFKVSQLDKNVKNLNVDATFTKVQLNVKDDYDFDVSTRLGDFSYSTAPVSIISQTPEENSRRYNTTKTYKGKVGKGNSDKVITVKASYTNVKFD